MVELAEKRLEENIKKSSRYLRLVSNDSLALALISLFGGSMCWYTQNLLEIPTNP